MAPDAGSSSSTDSAGTSTTDGGHAPSGAGGTTAAAAGGTAGVGTPGAATNAKECVAGAGGACADSCNYVSVEFSEPLPAANLELEVRTSKGDMLTPTTDDGSVSFSPQPALIVKPNSDRSQALGFDIRMIAGQDYAPEWVDVVLRSDDHTAADSRLSFSYSCAALRCQWCWKADTVTLQVTTP